MGSWAAPVAIKDPGRKPSSTFLLPGSIPQPEDVTRAPVGAVGGAVAASEAALPHSSKFKCGDAVDAVEGQIGSFAAIHAGGFE